MVSLLPEDSPRRLRKYFGAKFGRLNPIEVQALVTADLEGSVSNRRLQEICAEHPADLTKLLHKLVATGFLRQDGQRRTSYLLSGSPEQRALGLLHSGVSSSHKGDSLHSEPEDLSHKLDDLPDGLLRKLHAIALPASESPRLPVDETREILVRLCEGRYFTAADLAQLTKRNTNSLRNRFLKPMVDEGLLEWKYPEEPNRPDQAYTTKP